MFEEKKGFPDKNQIINELVDQYFQWIYNCLDTFGINGALEIIISKLTESSRQSYHTEWCRFIHFLFNVSNNQITLNFVKEFDTELLEAITELNA